MNNFLHLLLILLIFIKTAYSADKEDALPSQRYVYIIVPGQGNFGGTEHDDKLPQTIPEHYKKEVIRLKTPHAKTNNFFCNKDDFGQNNCQDLLHEKLDELFAQANIKFIIHAYSQGTASILNYISGLELADQNKEEKRTSKIEALILESVMISGFSAINHFVGKHFHYCGLPVGFFCSQLLYSDYWIPILAHKTTFPNFDINGTQTIDILGNIPKTFPIIILHTPKDYVLPFDGALAAYQTLLKHKNNNVYFIPVDRNIHIDMTSPHIQHKEDPGSFLELQSKGDNARAKVINILKMLDIYDLTKTEEGSDKEKSDIDLTQFQPKFDRHYDKKHRKNVDNTRSFYNTLVSTATTMKNLAPVMTFFALSYVHYRAQKA